MPHASNRLDMNAAVGPSVVRRGCSGNMSRPGMVMRAVPRSPPTALLARPGDIVVAKKEISLKFIEVGYLCAFAGNASQQGPQHCIVQVGDVGKNNAPWVSNTRIQNRQSKQMTLGPPRNAADDSSHYLFASTIKAMDFDDLAGEQLSVHFDGRALPADVDGLSFPQNLFAASTNT
jgi:hypothetical protein